MATELHRWVGIFLIIMTNGLLMTMNTSAAGGDYPLDQYPFHQDSAELVVTRSEKTMLELSDSSPAYDYVHSLRGDRVVTTLPCQRIPLKVEGRITHHIGASVGRTSDGRLYVLVSGGPAIWFTSMDDGRTWTRYPANATEVGSIGQFVVLADNSFLGAVGGASQPIGFYRSTDRGVSWERISQIRLQPFDAMYPDGSLLQLRNGTILFPVNWRVKAPEGGNVMRQGLFVQYVVRSTDGGRSWHNLPDPVLWSTLKKAKLTIAGVEQQARYPGPGGTFPGCWETGLAEIRDGTILAALRYSGAPEPWHTPEIVKAWRGGEPDIHGRMFKNVLLGDSPDGGHTWQTLRPVVDAKGRTLLPRYDTSAVLEQMSDSRLVMVTVRRGPYGQCQLVGKVSENGGRTWLPEEYRVMAGFGYPEIQALPDGTIITVSGKTVPKEGVRMSERPKGAEVIRWRLLEQ